MVELVENKINDEMSAAPIGAIMHDGWSRSSVHYVGLYACHNKLANGLPKPKKALLAVAPMPKATNEEDDGTSNDSETTRFNAEAHVNFVRTTFAEFCPSVDPDKWITCQIADNTSTNKRMARMMKIEHVGCKSHLLNLDVNDMMKEDAGLSKLIDQVHETMLSIKTKLTNAALLRNITDLKPIIHNETRWSGKFDMCARCVRLFNSIESASTEEENTIDFQPQVAGLAKSKKVTAMLQELNDVTKFLQTDNLSLAFGRNALDELDKQVRRNNGNREHVLHNCRFKLNKAHLNSPLAPDIDFESGVIKLQAGRHDELTEEEEEACESLKKPTRDAGSDSEPNQAATGESPEKMQDRLKRMLKGKPKDDKPNATANPCHNVDFIFASAAAVERLWSIASSVLSNRRRAMTPQMFETVLFLIENRHFWDDNLVAQAIHAARTDRLNARNEREAAEEAIMA